MLEINHLIKDFGTKRIFELERFTLSRGDKVAVVGANGTGKTTLFKLITGELESDGGTVNVSGDIAVIPQVYEPEGEGLAFSGGEKTKESIARAFSVSSDILLADEPTTHLDMGGISRLEALLDGYRGGLMLISHDRMLLRNVCNRVLEIDRGVCRLYRCGYEDYRAQKALEAGADKARYEKYVEERDRLKGVVIEKARQSESVKRAPRRMGNSEARLHKMGGQKQKEKLDRAAKAARSRLMQLEKVEKPWEGRPISFDLRSGALHSPVLVDINDVTKDYGERRVLEGCCFTVPGGKKTALIGENGSGKTTLLDMIASRGEGVHTCGGLKIGYFRQDTGGIDDRRSLLENAMAYTAYDECFVRTILSRLLFARDAMHHSAGTLSGGERVKLSLAQIILGDYHLLLLDEPTNSLDIEARDALESVLSAYPGAVLFVSHDRAFVENVADRIVYLAGKTAHTFEGGLRALRQDAAHRDFCYTFCPEYDKI